MYSNQTNVPLFCHLSIYLLSLSKCLNLLLQRDDFCLYLGTFFVSAENKNIAKRKATEKKPTECDKN